MTKLTFLFSCLLLTAGFSSCSSVREPYELNVAQAWDIHDTYKKVLTEVQGGKDVDDMTVDYMIIEAERRIQELIDNDLIKPAKK